MTVDKLSIVSFNSSRKGLQALSPGHRPSYLQRIIEHASPGICFLPGDDKTAKLHVIRGYDQFTVPHADDTVLLYDTNTVTMNKPKVDFNSFGPIPGLDYNMMVVPEVDVSTLLPVKSVVKRFNIVSWKYDMYESACGNGFSKISIEKFAEGIIKFSQRLAMTNGRPVLIGGEMRIDFNILMKIVKKLSADGQQEFLNGLQPIMGEHSFLPSMTKSVSKCDRHLFMMNVFRCESSKKEEIVRTWDNYTEAKPVADCFIASKQLELNEATLLDVEQVTGRQICMPVLAAHRPTQTHMEIPVRPPKHHGG